MIAIVDYGTGNVASIANMLQHIGTDEVVVTRDPATLTRANGLILAGVGAFGTGMKRLAGTGLVPLVKGRVYDNQVPLLGICLGMQMLGDGSDEGGGEGLGFVRGRCERFADGEGMRVPHMGWSDVTFAPASRLGKGLTDPRFYFVHSYHLVCKDKTDVSGTAQYGGPVTAAVERGNVMGVQFHPEKSHHFGMALLQNFVDVVG